MSFRTGLKSVVLAITVAAPLSGVPFLAQLPFASAQQTGATVHGTVADPTGAVIPGATVTLTPAKGKAILATTQGDGTYTLPNVPPGIYSETVTMPGFASFAKLNLRIVAGQALAADVKLAIQEQSQQVNVTAEGATVSTDPDSNASATIISGKDLDALSDDPDELSDELTALAGPSAGPNGGQIYVDGFTGGQLPPKSSIREIRINQNPFSAEYDKLGYGRVEIFTKPGTDKYHGNFQVNGNANFLNTSNPFLGDTPQLPYHTLFLLGNITGPLSPKASFSVGGSHRDIEQNTIFDGTLLASSPTATTPCPPGTPEAPSTCSVFLNTVIPVFYPQTRTDFTPRVDLQLSEKNTLTTRYQFETSSWVNDGTGGSDLPSTAFNLAQTENTLQMTDTQIVSPRVINETRFEYQRDMSAQTPLSTAPTVNVQGSFTSGASSTQLINDHQDHFEVQNYTSIQLKKNFIRLGGRFRSTSDAQYTNSGSNQTFTYSCLLAAGCQPDSNNVVSSYQTGQVAQYSYNDVVHGSTQATLADLGVYAEDDWKLQQNLTISYGLRYETENYMSDHHDFAPRLSFAWGVGKKSAPQTVIRGGFGIFYERFNLTNVVTTRQQNGTNVLSSIVRDPSSDCSPSDPSACSPCNPASVASCSGSTLVGLKTYSLDPNLRTPYIMQSALGVDEQLGKLGTLSINYQNAHGVHEYNSADESLINPAPEFVNGVPVAYAYRFQSEGLFNQSQLSISPRINYGRGISLWGYYVLNFANSDTSGAGDFPSQPANLRADYGRASFDVRNRVAMGGSFTFPHLITFSPFLVASSGQPFNIYTGTDLNDDGLLNNDRPAYATAATLKPVTTKYGVFDLNPAADEARIPVNLGKGPALLSVNLRVAKVFGFGGEVAHDQGDNHGGPSGPPGSHRGGGGGGGGGGPFGGGATSGRRYNLSIGLQAANLFNDVDLAAPNGNLSSLQFGQSTQLAGGFYTTNSALRRITLQTSFSF